MHAPTRAGRLPLFGLLAVDTTNTPPRRGGFWRCCCMPDGRHPQRKRPSIAATSASTSAPELWSLPLLLLGSAPPRGMLSTLSPLTLVGHSSGFTIDTARTTRAVAASCAGQPSRRQRRAGPRRSASCGQGNPWRRTSRPGSRCGAFCGDGGSSALARGATVASLFRTQLLVVVLRRQAAALLLPVRSGCPPESARPDQRAAGAFSGQGPSRLYCVEMAGVVDGIRVLRGAPTASVSAAAAAVGISRRQLMAKLGGLARRGRCAQMAAGGSWRFATAPIRREVVDHRMCPPFAVRRSREDPTSAPDTSGNGVAGWIGRSLEHPATPRAAFMAIRRDVHARSDMSERVDCPPAVMMRLATRSPRGTQTPWIASDTDEMAVLAALGAVGDIDTRENVATRSDLPLPLAIAAAGDTHWGSRRAVAETRRDLPVAVMVRLASDRDIDVREAVARNPSCPPRAAEILAHDPDAGPRAYIIANPATAADLVAELVRDEHPYVRRSATRNALVDDAGWLLLAADPEVSVRSDTAKSQACPAHCLDTLIKDRTAEVRLAAASGRGPLNEQHLMRLARDKAVTVRRAVASRESLPGPVRAVLRYDRDPKTREAMAAHDPRS